MRTLTKQDFIDIYKNNGKALADKETKEKAEQLIAKLDLPTKKDEEWRKTDIQPLLKHGFQYGEKKTLDKTIISMYNLSGIYANVLVFINGHFSKEMSKLSDNQDVLIFDSIRNARENYPGIFKKYFNKTDIAKHNIFTALNTAYAEDGAFILVKKNKKVENPIHVYFFADGDDNKVTSLTRNLIIAEQGSKANILFSYHSLSEDFGLTNVATEIFAEENAYVNFNLFQGEGDNAFQFNNNFVKQRAGSSFYAHTATMCGSIVKNDFFVELLEENAYTELDGLYLPDREQHFNNTLKVVHKSGHCVSNQFYRGILDNTASAVFSGTVLIEKGAIKSEAHQKNNNILLTKYAKVHSKPQLIIHNDDVVASHGSTVGQLDAEQLFYMRARGISEKKARTLLLKAFAEEVIDKIQIPQYHFYVKFLTEKRLAGEKIDSMCAKMGVCRK